jgi:hypothetical protein
MAERVVTPVEYPVLRRLLDEGAQLVEVLPAGEYAEMHLPGAVNIPLKTLDATSTAGLDRGRADVVTAGLDDAVAEVRARVAGSEHSFALVTANDGTLLGRLRGSTLTDADPAAAAAEVMEPGPSTLRPHEPADAIRAYLEDQA